MSFVSLGCPKNLVDSEVMLGLAEQAGHVVTTDAEGADVLVVNTCAFIDRAKQESIDTILEMAELKKLGAGRRLVVTGCLAERYRDELKKEIPEIDALLGTGEVEGIVDAIGLGAGRSALGAGRWALDIWALGAGADRVDARRGPVRGSRLEASGSGGIRQLSTSQSGSRWGTGELRGRTSEQQI